MVLGFAIDIRISLFLCLKYYFFFFKNRIDGKQVSFSPHGRFNEHFHANLNKKSQFPNFSNEFNDTVIIS